MAPLTAESINVNETLKPYVPRLLVDWLRREPSASVREVAGTLAFVDISGFTKMTERLARKGKVGSEEMNDLLDSCFTQLLGVAYRDGAGLVKWGGDAVLLLFEGEGHAARACRAAHGMRRTLREMGRIPSSAGFVTLRMSVGVHSGTFHFFLVGEQHRELVIAGPAATHTVLMESTAAAGEILMSAATADLVDARVVGAPKGDGFLLRSVPNVPHEAAEPAPDVSGLDLARCLPGGVREHLLSGPREAEHRRVAVAFIEFWGTDELLERSGPGAVAMALDQCIRTVQEETERHGVTFLETDISGNGGKILLVAGAPRSSGNDEDGMLLAVRSIIDRPGTLALRVGVNSGRVFTGDFGPEFRRTYSIKGDAVNLAARVMGKAGFGEILATEAALARSRTPFEAEALAPFTVKGKGKPVQAFSLGSAGRRPVAADEATPMIGREQELVRLFEALDSAAQRRGRVVELVGEPGIGKSRLVHELTSRAGGMTVLIARCEMYESSTPYHAFRGLLRHLLSITDDEDPHASAQRLRERIESNAPQLLPWLPLLGVPMDIQMPATQEIDQLDDEFRRRKLEEVTAEFLEWVLPTPTVFVFDDTHWMDEASSDLLRRIVERAARLPWLLLVTRREDGAGFRSPEGIGGVTLELKPLDVSHAETLAENATEERPLARHELAALVERSGGNPLFLRELIAVAHSAGRAEALPETVEGVMTAQIDRLDPPDRTLLRFAAVLGASFRGELLTEMLEDEEVLPDDGAWRRLADLVQEREPGWYSFRHVLIRDAAYEGLSYRRRRELHARAGDAIERAAGGLVDEHAELLSMHFFHARRFEDAWRFSCIAAKRAQDKYALVDAGNLYRRALDAARNLPAVPAREISEVHDVLGDLRDRVGAYEEAAGSYRAARRLVSDDPVAQAALMLKEAWIAERLGRYRLALSWVSRGHRILAGVDGVEAERQRARLSAWYAAIRQAQGRNREVLRWCRRAIEEAEASGEKDALAQAYFIMDWAHVGLGELDRATNSQRALEIYEELGNLGTAANVLNNMGMFAYYRGRWDEAIDLYQRGHDARVKIGNTVDAVMGKENIGEILSDQGRLEEAEAIFRDVLRVWVAAGAKEGIALTTSHLGRVASRSGRYEKALEMFDQAHRMFEEMGAEAELLETEARIAECLLFDGNYEQALARCGRALKAARTLGGIPPQMPLLFRIEGLALIRQGRPAEARDALEESLAAARSRSADYEIALTLRALADIARLAGDPVDEEAERESRAILERLGVISIPGVVSVPDVLPVPG